MGARILKVLAVAAIVATTTSVAVGTYLRRQQKCTRVTLVPVRKPADQEIRRTVHVLSKRADEIGADFGVVRADIRATEEGTITAELWSDRDPKPFIEQFAGVGDMELRFVASRKQRTPPGEEYEELPWRQTYYSLDPPGETYEKARMFWVKKTPELCVKAFKSVVFHTEHLASEPVITVQLCAADAKAFNEIRRNNHGKELAVVIDGEILFSAVIADAVETDRIQIRGIRGIDEAKRVQRTLEIGALPVGFKVEEIHPQK